ncbi:hypothetical protein PO124_16605 [Bacillus licheniformis]|nr:hypothetical protein [Bacillus licheniformis]
MGSVFRRQSDCQLFVCLPNRSTYEETFSADSNTARSSMTCLSPTTKKSCFDSRGWMPAACAAISRSKSRKAVIISHGIKWSLFGGYKYVELFQSIGYNVLLCDSRCHGLSGGSHVSYGFTKG